MKREDIKHIIEAVMFAYAEPISIKELNDIINGCIYNYRFFKFFLLFKMKGMILC